jgi:hypothetical protein
VLRTAPAHCWLVAQYNFLGPEIRVFAPRRREQSRFATQSSRGRRPIDAQPSHLSGVASSGSLLGRMTQKPPLGPLPPAEIGPSSCRCVRYVNTTTARGFLRRFRNDDRTRWAGTSVCPTAGRESRPSPEASLGQAYHPTLACPPDAGGGPEPPCATVDSVQLELRQF